MLKKFVIISQTILNIMQEFSLKESSRSLNNYQIFLMAEELCQNIRKRICMSAFFKIIELFTGLNQMLLKSWLWSIRLGFYQNCNITYRCIFKEEGHTAVCMHSADLEREQSFVRIDYRWL
jgi:hypothetical protein